jgi:hypothetical protein
MAPHRQSAGSASACAGIVRYETKPLLLTHCFNANKISNLQNAANAVKEVALNVQSK